MPDSPATTTSGELPRFAWYIIPIPLPRPTPLCSCTTVGLTVARAYASAMATAIVSWSAVTYVSSGTSSRASRKPCSTVPGLPNMYVIPSARSCSRIAKRPVLPGIPGASLPGAGGFGGGVEPPLAEALLEHLDHLLTGQVRVRRRAARDERVVDDDGGLVAVVAVVGTTGR